MGVFNHIQYNTIQYNTIQETLFDEEYADYYNNILPSGPLKIGYWKRETQKLKNGNNWNTAVYASSSHWFA